MVAYHIKAFREAKQRTSWVNPNEPFENRIAAFLNGILSNPSNRDFLEQLRAFRQRIDLAGVSNALAQVTLKCTIPGVPDFYQGCELWNFSLVDPDNRRPVDYEERAETLKGMRRELEHDRKATIVRLLDRWQSGHVKLFLTHAMLQFRQQHPDIFLQGEYIPLEVVGTRSGHVIAFARRRGDGWSISVVPRLPFALTSGSELPMGAACWEDTAIELPADSPLHWQDVVTRNVFDARSTEKRKRIPVSELLAEFPVAVLKNDRLGA
jgi:(1->4)-alpha-D-glucan 1-alpha-D-glucosylmutase